LWYNSYWGYYWGNPWYYDPIGNNIGYAGCSQWRAVLAFSFMAAITYLISSILVSSPPTPVFGLLVIEDVMANLIQGLIVVVKHYKVGRKNKVNP
jgi:hypothetical protein